MGSRFQPSRFRKKLKPDGSTDRFKARLVVRGFTQREGLDYTKTFSPMVRSSSVRTLLAVAANEGYAMHKMDVQTAFLNGTLEEEVYMEQAKGFVNPKHPVQIPNTLTGSANSRNPCMD